jgi:hypothetical protein
MMEQLKSKPIFDWFRLHVDALGCGLENRADRILVQAAARDAAVTVDRTDQWIDLNSSMSALSNLTN